jgi:hypothetical protein
MLAKIEMAVMSTIKLKMDVQTKTVLLYCRSAVESTLGSQASVALVVPNRNSRLGTFILCCADKQAQNLFENRDRFGK